MSSAIALFATSGRLPRSFSPFLMTKKFLSFVVAGAVLAAPALSFAEDMSDDSASSSSSSVSSSSSSSVASVTTAPKGPCAGMQGRDFATCMRVKNLKVRAQRTMSRAEDRKTKRLDEKTESAMKKQQKSLRKLLRRQVEAVSKACGSTKGQARIQCIKDQRNSK